MAADTDYPDFYPEECPPADAPPAGGTVFRLVRGTVPSPSDFVPVAIENPSRLTAKTRCLGCGLTVFREVADVEQLQKRVAGHRDKRVAVGTLDEAAGVLKPTGKPSHHTWWVRRGFDPVSCFKVDENQGSAA